MYANVERQPLATSPAAAAPPGPGPLWETHTDADTGRPYYYNPDTGVTTWELPFEAAEGASSPATSPASVDSRESFETEWGQYWDEDSRKVFFYNPLTGETVWEDEPEDQLEMQPGLSPCSPSDQRVRGGAGRDGWGRLGRPLTPPPAPHGRETALRGGARGQQRPQDPLSLSFAFCSPPPPRPTTRSC